jgi:hypothetical protein
MVPGAGHRDRHLSRLRGCRAGAERGRPADHARRLRRWAAVAEEGLSSLGLGRVEFSVGPIAGKLPDALERSAPVDYAFVDAEHTEEATVGYFESIVPHMSPQGVMVFVTSPGAAS